MYEDILTLIIYIYIYGLVRAAHSWFKEFSKTMTLEAGFKECKTDTCLLYRANGLCMVIVIVYLDDTLKIGDKPEFMNTIECDKQTVVSQILGTSY